MSGSHTTATTSVTSASSTIATPTSQSCNDNYTIKSGDTCNSVSIAQKASTFSLLYENGLQGYCTNFPTQGSICLPQTCDIYTVATKDTCYGIAQSFSHEKTFSVSQLISWNLNINRDCSNMDQLVGYQICIRWVGLCMLSNTRADATLYTSFPGDTAASNASKPATQVAYVLHWYIIRTHVLIGSCDLDLALPMLPMVPTQIVRHAAERDSNVLLVLYSMEDML